MNVIKRIKKWLQNKEIQRLKAELARSMEANEEIYDYFWPNDEWVGWVNIDVKHMLHLTQKTKDLVYSKRKNKRNS